MHPSTVPPCCAPEETFCGVQAARHMLALPLQVSATAAALNPIASVAQRNMLRYTARLPGLSALDHSYRH
jgi:hypothetical protein